MNFLSLHGSHAVELERLSVLIPDLGPVSQREECVTSFLFPFPISLDCARVTALTAELIKSEPDPVPVPELKLEEDFPVELLRVGG
jgi:hypothetical protein